VLFFVTDGYKGHIEPMEDVFEGAKYQLCNFHVMRDINKEIRRYCGRKKKKAEGEIKQSVKEVSKECRIE
jgi:transposase-like protein